MDCKTARKNYDIPISEIKEDILKETWNHVDKCFACKEYYKDKHLKKMGKLANVS